MIPHSTSTPWRVIRRALIALAVLPLLLSAQTTPAPDTTPAADTTPPKPDDTIKMSPFFIKDSVVQGWNSQMTFSGSRTAQDLLEIPVNISVITSDYLKDTGATNALGIFEYAASGVTNRVSYRDDYTIRGYRQGKTVDGLGQGSIGYAPLYDVERIEVVKGPTALVFSNFGNISGTVNYVTKRPTSTPMGDASFSIGSFGLYTANATQRGPITTDGSVRYRLTIGDSENDGWRAHGTAANSYTNNRMISASVDWSASKNLEVLFDAGYKYERHRDNQESLIDPATQKVWSGSVNGFTMASDWNHITTIESRFRVQAIYTVTPDLTIRFLHNEYAGIWDFSVDWSGAGLVAAEGPNYQTLPKMVNQIYHSNPTIADTIVDLNWRATLGAHFVNSINAGWQYNQNNTTILEYDVPMADLLINAPISSRAPESSDAAKAAFVAATGNPLFQARNGGWTSYFRDSLEAFDGKLIMSAGFRYVSRTAGSLPRSDTLPNYGVIYRVSPTVSLYGERSESWTPRVGVDVFGTPLVDTFGKSTEGGVKFNAFNGHLFGTVDYYSIANDPVFRQIQVTDPVTGIITRGNALVGKETNKGFEADIGWVQPFTVGRWSTFVTAFSAKPANALGLVPSSAVKEKYTLFTKFDITTGSLSGAFIGGGISHTGSSPGTGFPTNPAYTLGSLLFGYGRNNWRIACNVDNVANKRDAVIGSEGSAFVYLAAPRTWKLTLSKTW